MSINADKPHRWKADIAASVDLFNKRFLAFAPKAYREGRVYGGGLHKMEPKELARVSAAALWEAVAEASGQSLPIKPEQLALAW